MSNLPADLLSAWEQAKKAEAEFKAVFEKFKAVDPPMESKEWQSLMAELKEAQKRRRAANTALGESFDSHTSKPPKS